MRLRTALKSLANWHVAGSKPSIFIISTPRSGSTWLMELILSEEGTKPCNEPFDIRKPYIAEKLGISEWRDLYDVNMRPTLEKYLTAYIEGRPGVAFKNFQPWDKYYRFHTNRIVFKILHACENQIEWIKSTFSAHIVFLIRHPIPVALSRKQLPRLEAFISSDFSECLTVEQLNMARNIFSNGTHLERALLDWCLQNKAVLLSRHAIDLMITYEQLVLDPAKVLSVIAQTLDLNNYEKMCKNLMQPSLSTRQSSQETITALTDIERDRKWLVEKWRKQITAETESELMQMLKVFDLDVYTANSAIPAAEYYI